MKELFDITAKAYHRAVDAAMRDIASLEANVRVLKSTVVVLATALSALLLALAFSPSANAASCGPQVESITKNCTDNVCTATACWAQTQEVMTGCNLYIVAPGGALPPVSGVVNASKDICTITMPKLITGKHTITAKGVGPFGEGPANAVPLALSTGTAPGAPSRVAVE